MTTGTPEQTHDTWPLTLLPQDSRLNPDIDTVPLTDINTLSTPESQYTLIIPLWIYKDLFITLPIELTTFFAF